MLGQLSSKFNFYTYNYAFCSSGKTYELTSFHQMLTDSSHILAVSIDKRISFPLRFSPTAQDFGMAICRKQMTFWHWTLNGFTFSHILGPCSVFPVQGLWPTDGCGRFNKLKKKKIQRCSLLRYTTFFLLFSWDCFIMAKFRGRHLPFTMTGGIGAQDTEIYFIRVDIQNTIHI